MTDEPRKQSRGTRVLLDLRCLETPSAQRGVGRHTRELGLALRAQLPGDWSLYGLSWSGAASELGIGDIRYPGPRRAISFADRYYLPRLLRQHAIDVYHSPVYALPGGVETARALILTVHDLVAEIHPSAVHWRHRMVFRRTFRSALKARRVITVSETTRKELLRRFNLDASRVRAVPNGVSSSFSMGTSTDTAPFPEPYLLYVGGLDPLKNVSYLFQVLRRVQAELPNMKLVIVGPGAHQHQALKDKAAELGLSTSVVLPGFVSDAQLGDAYRHATAFVFPSLYEGFGLPPLEAMLAGCPVVSSPHGSLREVLSPAAILLDPDDPEKWCQAILQLIRQPEQRRTMIEKALRHAQTFSWQRTAEQTLEVYLEALNEAHKS